MSPKKKHSPLAALKIINLEKILPTNTPPLNLPESLYPPCRTFFQQKSRCSFPLTYPRRHRPYNERTETHAQHAPLIVPPATASAAASRPKVSDR